MKTQNLVLCGMFTALMILGAYLRIPLPFLGTSLTLQVLFCMSSGLLLGAKWGALSTACYIALGLIGIPVFTKGGGIAYIFQYEFGYLLGFVAMAATAGFARRRLLLDKPLLSASLAALLSILAMYAVALPYIYLLSAFYVGEAIPPASLLALFCIGFLPMDLFKGALAILSCEAFRSRIGFLRIKKYTQKNKA